jgi:uncharacterized membrane protein YeaQ/YmgE (transglycosylase-associated protein family)
MAMESRPIPADSRSIATWGERKEAAMLDFSFDVGLWGWLILIVGALLLGVIAQLIGTARFGYEWIITAIAAFVGAFAASEFIVDWRAYQPVFDNLALIPALIGGVVVGVVIAVAMRLVTGGTYLGETS